MIKSLALLEIVGKQFGRRQDFFILFRELAQIKVAIGGDKVFNRIATIIRKTKRFAIPERAVYFLKTKRTAGGTPPPQNIFDRLTPVFT